LALISTLGLRVPKIAGLRARGKSDLENEPQIPGGSQEATE